MRLLGHRAQSKLALLSCHGVCTHRGVTLFREGVRSVGECIGALVILVTGIFGVALSPTELPNKVAHRCCAEQGGTHGSTPLSSHADTGRSSSSQFKAAEAIELATAGTNAATEAGEKAAPIKQENAAGAPAISRRVGLLCALVVGLVDGSLMVPYKSFLDDPRFSRPASSNTTTTTSAAASAAASIAASSVTTSDRGVSVENSYIVSLGVGLLMVAPAFSVLYIVGANGCRVPQLKFSQVLSVARVRAHEGKLSNTDLCCESVYFFVYS